MAGGGVLRWISGDFRGDDRLLAFQIFSSGVIWKSQRTFSCCTVSATFAICLVLSVDAGSRNSPLIDFPPLFGDTAKTCYSLLGRLLAANVGGLIFWRIFAPIVPRLCALYFGCEHVLIAFSALVCSLGFEMREEYRFAEPTR